MPERTDWIFPNTTDEYAGHLSPSQITSFLRCGECYRLSRVEKMPRPLGVNLAIGSAVHKAIETARLKLLGAGAGSDYGGPPLRAYVDEFEQTAADWFDQQCAQPNLPEEGLLAEVDLGSHYSSLGEAKDHTVALTRFVVPEVLKLDRQRGKIAAVEYNLLSLPSPYPFAVEGRLDCLYVDWLADHTKPEQATLMADLKTSSKQEPPDEYTAIAQTIYEEFWTSRGLPLTVLVDVADKRKRPELKTYPMIVDDYARELTHSTVMGVAEDICAGRFRATPTWACDYIHGFASFQIAVQGFAEAV